jgi:hypothetical protein
MFQSGTFGTADPQVRLPDSALGASWACRLRPASGTGFCKDGDVGDFKSRRMSIDMVAQI